MSPAEEPRNLDHRMARFLTIRYALALGLVAALAIGTQVVVQVSLARQAHDARTINLAGRQRMLSQRLCKAVLAEREARRDGRVTAAWREEIETVLGEWSAAHQRLTAASGSPGMGADNSSEVAALLVELTPVHVGMVADATAAAEDQAAVERLLAREAAFLSRMEAVVGAYDGEARARVEALARLELLLLAAALVVLVLEALMVFAPAVRRIRAAIAEREVLRRQELDLELAAAAERVTRGIGQDLHDGLGQRLTGLSLQAAALQRRLATAAEPGHAELAAGIASEARNAVGQARAMAHRLAPLEVVDTALGDALHRLAHDAAEASGLTCTATCDSAADPQQVAMAAEIFRIAQEALTNALRHARASTITLSLSRDGGEAVLGIEDDGVGIPPGAAAGMGLRAMAHRAARLGGSITIAAAAPQGTRIICRWPLPPQGQEAPPPSYPPSP
jgi:signal transduction histidine kinase